MLASPSPTISLRRFEQNRKSPRYLRKLRSRRSKGINAPSAEATKAHPPVVIIGGGVIGCATALYLAHARENGNSITIVEKGSELFAGASGNANGVLGNYGFDQQVQSLGELSWKMHQDLARTHGGRTNWGFRDLNVHHLWRAGSTDAPNSVYGPTQVPPNWVRRLKGLKDRSLPTHEHAARINPIEFCTFLRESCEATGVKVVKSAIVADVGIQNECLKTVTIAQQRKRWSIPCHSLVIAAGPWSEGVLNDLFPNSLVRIPSNNDSHSGNYIIMKNPKWEDGDSEQSCDQVLLEGICGQKVDASSRADGTIYIGGSLSTFELLPDTTTDVKVQLASVFEMIRAVAKILNFTADESEVLRVGRAYRPVFAQGRPIIAHVAVSDLLGVDRTSPNGAGEIKGRAMGGVFLSVGHGWDGITLAPGSGKVLSELIQEGRAHSADISGLSLEAKS